MYYTFAYLVLEQQFLCNKSGLESVASTSESGLYEQCTTKEICALRKADSSFSAYKVDTSYQYYLENWYTEMDLMCQTPAAIGFIISAYYIGFAIGGLFFAFPDKYGRKKSLIFGQVLNCISQTVMIYVPNYWIRFAMFGLAGLSQIKNSVSYVWLSECTSKPFKTRAFTIINIIDALPILLYCLYFMFIGKNWMYLSLLFCILSYIALFAAFICPESPRWLLVNGRTEDAIVELNKIAKMNKSTMLIPTSAVFVENPNSI